MTTQPSKQQVAAAKPAKEDRKLLVPRFAAKYGIEPGKMIGVLRNTAFKVKKTEAPATDDELAQLLVVADHYNLNPFLREVYAFRGQHGGIVPIIGYDGWIRLVEAQPAYNGCTFTQGFDESTIGGKEDSPARGFYYECTMYRKDRTHPTIVREYLTENYRNTDPWNGMPNRMTRMRSYIQCARMAFGFGGIYDQDEGEVVSLGAGVDYMPKAGQAMQPAAASSAEDPPVTDEQIEAIVERLGRTGVQDNLVFAKFEVGAFSELKFNQVPDVLKFISDNAP
jgi:phage recombination protein Bet